ncbi:6-phosphogluconate dehydrogenase C-terminal domain-like protein [Sparassis latifolia]
MSLATPPTLAIVSIGAMGSGVAARLAAHGCTLLTTLAGRSPATRARAARLGIRDARIEDIAQHAELVLSILPPSAAEAFAEGYRAARARVISAEPQLPTATFADCNAVSPDTATSIGALFAGPTLRVRFVDAGIIGGPPRAGYDPVFYASADAPEALAHFASLRTWGLNVSAMEGAGAGGASALKMSYAGISKGITGLCTAMVLAAHANSPRTAQALLHELAASQPAVLQRMARGIPDMLPKAYRWVGEMEEISAFVAEGAAASSGERPGAGLGVDKGGEELIHLGLARLYERVERSLRAGEGGADVQVLKGFVEDAKRVLEAKEEGEQ